MSDKKVTNIFVTFQREGIHRYPEALDSPALATNDWDDVSFLGHPHRHMFHFRVDVSVNHHNRHIEFIQFKRWLERQYSEEGVLALDYKSCEMMADELLQLISIKYPQLSMIRVEVSEDGENGAWIMWEENGGG